MSTYPSFRRATTVLSSYNLVILYRMFILTGLLRLLFPNSTAKTDHVNLFHISLHSFNDCVLEYAVVCVYSSNVFAKYSILFTVYKTIVKYRPTILHYLINVLDISETLHCSISAPHLKIVPLLDVHQLLMLFAGTLMYSEPGTFSSVVFYNTV
jgi:hypothetical protein